MTQPLLTGGAPYVEILPHLDPEGAEPNVRTLWGVLLRNRWIIASALILAVGAASLWNARAVPIYEASTSIRIDERHADIPALDALRGMSQGSEVSTEMEVLRSRLLAEDVAKTLGLQVTVGSPAKLRRSSLLMGINAAPDAPAAVYELRRIADTAFRVSDARTHRVFGSFEIGHAVQLPGATFTLVPEALRYERILVRIQPLIRAAESARRATSVTRKDRDADLITVRYQSPDPELARDVPNALASTFIRRRQTVQKTEARSTAQFIRNQLDTLSRQLRAAEDSLRFFRQGQQVVNLQAEGTADITQLAQLQAQRQGIEAEREALSKLLAEVQLASTHTGPNEPSPYRRLIAFPSLLKNSVASELLHSLNEADDQRATLLSRRTLEDPDVIQLSSRIATLEKQLQEIAVTYAQGLANQVIAIDRQLGLAGQALSRIPAKEIEVARLQRQPKVLEEIFTLLQSRLKETEIAEAVEDPSVRVIDGAVLPEVPIRPNKRLNLLLGIMVGLLVGFSSAMLREHMDRTVHTREQLQSAIQVSILGAIPNIRDVLPRPSGRLQKSGIVRAISGMVGDNRNGNGHQLERTATSLIVGADPKNSASEAYRALRTNITFSRPDQKIRTMVFTSPLPGDGKSTTAANLAATLAQQGLKVLLVDGDMRRGMLNQVFDMSREPGLSNLILKAASFATARRRIEVGESVAFDFLPTGTLPPNPAELLGSVGMRDLLLQLREEYEAVIIDSPPLNVVTDAAVLGPLVDGVILVARAGVTAVDSLAYAMDQLRNVRATVLGAVLNDLDMRRDSRYGYYGAYGYNAYKYQRGYYGLPEETKT